MPKSVSDEIAEVLHDLARHKMGMTCFREITGIAIEDPIKALQHAALEMEKARETIHNLRSAISLAGVQRGYRPMEPGQDPIEYLKGKYHGRIRMDSDTDV
jgi:hypothetical protein